MTDGNSWHDYKSSRAVLIGAWDYKNLPPVPSARRSLDRMAGLLTGDLCNWPVERVTELRNVNRSGDLHEQLMGLFEDIDDVALFYFVGHGQLHNDELCLALTDSPLEGWRRSTTGLAFAHVRKALLECDADTKIVILDCCFSGTATLPQHTLSTSNADVVDVVEKVSGTGAFTLAASGAFKRAWHESENSTIEPQTYFTKYFIDIIEQGVSEQPGGLTLREISDRTVEALARDRLPQPTRAVRNEAGRFIFARSAAPLWPSLRRGHDSKPEASPSSIPRVENTATRYTKRPHVPLPLRRQDASRSVPPRQPKLDVPFAVNAMEIKALWPSLLHAVGTLNLQAQALLQNATVRGVGFFTLVLTMPTVGLTRQLNQKSRIDVVESALHELIAGDWQVRCVFDEVSVIQQVWPELQRRASERNYAIKPLLHNAKLRSVDDGAITLVLPTAGLARQLNQASRIALIESILHELTTRKWKVHCTHQTDR